MIANLFKLLLIGVLTFTASLRSTSAAPDASNDSSDAKQPEASDPTEEGLVAANLVCAREILEKRYGGQAGIDSAAEIIEATLVGRRLHDRDLLNKVNSWCVTTLPKMQPAPMARHAQIAYVAMSEDLDRDTRTLMMDFLAPTITCSMVGIGLQIASFFSVGGKRGFAYCRGSNGRRWLEVSLGLGTAINRGLGVHLFANSGLLERKEIYSRSVVTLSSSKSVSSGAAVGRNIEWEGGSWIDSRQTADDVVANIFNRELSSYPKSASGRTVGLGITSSEYTQMNIKVIPLGTDDGYLVSRVDSVIQ